VILENNHRFLFPPTAQSRNEKLLFGVDVDEQARLEIGPKTLDFAAIVGFERVDQLIEKVLESAVIGEEMSADGGGRCVLGGHAKDRQQHACRRGFPQDRQNRRTASRCATTGRWSEAPAFTTQASTGSNAPSNKM